MAIINYVRYVFFFWLEKKTQTEARHTDNCVPEGCRQRQQTKIKPKTQITYEYSEQQEPVLWSMLLIEHNE